MNALPEWPQGTPGVLCVAGPHAIAVSTLVRAGDDRLVLALGRGRETLARLRAQPRVAFCLLAPGVAFTAYGRARVVSEELEAAPVSAIAVDVERIQDHLADGRTEMVDGARWRWSDERAREEEPAIVEELRRLGGAC